MDLDKFNRDKEIDPSQLDVAAATQADVFFDWAEKLVRARMYFDREKLRLELITSRLNMNARANPGDFGLAKVTEAGLGDAIRRHPELKDQQKKLLDAREKMLLLEAAVEAMNQRKRMIEVLITLHGQQYFAGPSTPRDLVSAYREYREKKQEQVASVQRERARRRTPGNGESK